MRRKYSLTIDRNMVFLDKVSVDYSKGLWRVFLVKKCGGLVLALIMMMLLLLGAASAEETLQAGDVVYLGAYEQDNKTDNGDEPIAWLVLTEESDMMMDKPQELSWTRKAPICALKSL